MGVLIVSLLMVIYVALAFEVDRRKRICIGSNQKYTVKRRINLRKKCARFLNVLLFKT
ncbi:hypothetical protein FHU10_4807 [Serratia fonticola]|uniref:Uncharacterized protein n=1 Tax=Serratia fonticola TaxID=47917 RepID=A0A542BP21_SERFO|nr:hypothetical protein FHU09_2896 [Serratia fonticola]TQI97641.1 hypothetical protein FHU11_3147 [Serratia fonticola]TVZ72139.1 hypothetical protein FHU10_4807 [Serratia fonticola]